MGFYGVSMPHRITRFSVHNERRVKREKGLKLNSVNSFNDASAWALSPQPAYHINLIIIKCNEYLELRKWDWLGRRCWCIYVVMKARKTKGEQPNRWDGPPSFMLLLYYFFFFARVTHKSMFKFKQSTIYANASRIYNVRGYTLFAFSDFFSFFRSLNFFKFILCQSANTGLTEFV